MDVKVLILQVWQRQRTIDENNCIVVLVLHEEKENSCEGCPEGQTRKAFATMPVTSSLCIYILSGLDVVVLHALLCPKLTWILKFSSFIEI